MYIFSGTKNITIQFLKKTKRFIIQPTKQFEVLHFLMTFLFFYANNLKIFNNIRCRSVSGYRLSPL